MTETAVPFTGSVLEQGDAGYDEARRVFNGLVDRRPDRIMRCTSSAEVQAAVRAARAASLRLMAALFTGGLLWAGGLLLLVAEAIPVAIGWPLALVGLAVALVTRRWMRRPARTSDQDEPAGKHAS